MILRRTAGLASSTVKRSLACSTEACTARLSRDAAAAGAIVAASGQYHRLPKIPSSTCTFIQRRHISSSGPASATSAPLEVNNGTTRRPLHLVILGAPGAGKGTQTDSILRRYDVRALVVGNLLRDEVSKKTELGLRAASVMKAGGLLDDQTILEVVKPGLKQLNGTNWILDGYPRTPGQAHDLDNALAEWNESINLVVNLDVPDEVLIERIQARYVHLPSGRVYNTSYNPPKREGLDDLTGEPLTKRMDDRPEIFQKRLDQFHRENEPIKAFYKQKNALVNLTGRTSAEIWPKLEKLLNERYPHIRQRASTA